MFQEQEDDSSLPDFEICVKKHIFKWPLFEKQPFLTTFPHFPSLARATVGVEMGYVEVDVAGNKNNETHEGQTNPQTSLIQWFVFIHSFIHLLPKNLLLRQASF